MSKKVVVVGQGYVGLPLAMRAVEVGHTVVGLDTNARRTEALLRGESFVGDVSDTDLRQSLGSGRYHPTACTADCAGFDIAVVTVPTPLRERLPDLSFIETAARDLAPFLSRGALVVLESTTYPGTTQEIVVPLLEQGSGLRCGSDFFVGYSPERIDPGNRTWTFVTTPKVVSGVDAASLDATQKFYDGLVDKTVPVSSPKEAELAKLLENTFRHVNIALVNELAVFARELDINIWEAIDAASSKPFGFMRFTPGPGVGGHCLPVDPSYLSWQVRRQLGRSFRFVELANDVNDHMPDYVVQRATALLNDQTKAVNGSTVLLLGLAYKKNSSDVRQAPSARVIQLLHAMGAHIQAIDPHLATMDVPQEVTMVSATAEVVAAADLVILLSDHDDLDLDLIVDSASCLLDTRGRLHGEHVSRL